MLTQTLRQSRQSLGLTQQQLADQLFVSRQTVSSWETGRNQPNLETLAKMAEVLGVTTDFLLGRATVKSRQLPSTLLASSLSMMICIRLVMATTSPVLWFEDALIVALTIALLHRHYQLETRWSDLPVTAVIGGVLLVSSMTNLFGMGLAIQATFILAGALIAADVVSRLHTPHTPRRWQLLKAKGLWLGNIIGIMVIIGLSALIITRRVDGSGFVETPATKMLELGIVGVITVAVIILELIAVLIKHRISHHG
ncbi:DUF3923 family protein [Lacticaseibacillus pantheris]|uniref:DUF3923 family protein n=1 Tax=Lacticaseibacillus pantheris TaxID=171523 RepID=UPI00265A7AEC|nr:DUF3923 family protein [Lacticaseibacillus pantheris]WKF85861.1 DUF3923 family protein [Lacticaseibacillus pantheris]